MRINFNLVNRFVIIVALGLLIFQPALAQIPSASPQSAQQIAAKVDDYMNAAVRFDRFSGSILVARDGSPIISKGYGMANVEWDIPNTPNTAFRIGAISRHFTAMAVMMLQERGKLKTGDLICKYLADCPAAWQTITIRHLLSHTSGIIPKQFPNDVLMSSLPVTHASLIGWFKDKPLEFAPGEKYSSSNVAYYLLGVIIERASGKSYADFLQENIFTPLGMTRSGYDDNSRIIKNRAAGYYAMTNAPYENMTVRFSAGGLYSTIEDMLLWDKALSTEKLVSQKSLDEMFTPVKPESAYGWDVGKMFDREFRKEDSGISGFSTYFIRFPSERVTVIVLSNETTTRSISIGNNLAAIVFGEPYQLPKPPISDVLSVTITQKGIASALQQYRELKRTQTDNYNFSEPVLNRLGYELLRNQKVKVAIEIFKLNVEMFPQSSNVYDSLGEAYTMNGDRELAIKNYEKSLELDPKNTNAVDRLKKLRGNK